MYSTWYYYGYFITFIIIPSYPTEQSNKQKPTDVFPSTSTNSGDSEDIQSVPLDKKRPLADEEHDDNQIIKKKPKGIFSMLQT